MSFSSNDLDASAASPARVQSAVSLFLAALQQCNSAVVNGVRVWSKYSIEV
jgi:hypothetical protein